MRRGARIAIAATVVAAAAIALSPPARAQVPVLRIEGRGWGHGVGLAQWGARHAADAGVDTATILSTFYPGTELALAEGAVRVAVHAGPDAVLGFPQGGELRSPLVGDQAPGFPVVVAPGGLVAVRPADGGFAVEGVVVAQSTTAPVLTRAQGCLPVLGPCPPPGAGSDDCVLGCAPTTAPPSAPTTVPPPTDPPATEPPPTDPAPPAPEPPPPPVVSAGSVYAVPAGDGVTDVTTRARQYRGIVEAVGDPAGLRLVNQLDVETYLKGMAEVPTSWPAAAQEAQAVAARTYVLRAMAASGEVCDHERCQVYVGATREDPAQSAAVDATSGVVLTYGGALAAAVYSADAGGITATAVEGFGPTSGDYPYLTNVRYDTPDPLPWAVDVALGDIGRRLGYPGAVTGARVVETGPSGRAVTMAIQGDAGEQRVDARTFARSIGLRSTLFTATAASAASAAPLPDAPALDEPMAMPDDAAALAAAVGRTATAAAEANAAASVQGVRTRSGARAGTSTGASAGPIDGRSVAVLAVAILGVVTAVAMARAGGLDAVTGSPATAIEPVSRRRPRSARPSSRAGPRPIPGRHRPPG